MKRIETYSAIISFSESIATAKFKDNIDVDIKEAKELIEVSLEIVQNERFYLLVDARDIYSSMDHEARKYISEHKEYNRLNIAQAIVVNNMPIRLIASAYYRFYPHANPVKVFSKMEEAKKWLFSHS